MLGWVLRRGLENAAGFNGRTEAGDTTQLEQPDTPAPVFAARALKTAIFGSPARPIEDIIESTSMDSPKSKEEPNDSSKTPSKPAGILLTPGTSTLRRKRVSFGQDVLDRAGRKSSRNGASDDYTSKDSKSGHKRTKLAEALENSRRSKRKEASSDAKIKKQEISQDAEEDEWEEEEDDFCTHDITIDLNEPHSRSGKYWKSNFEQYHQDAKAEMEKLLKYKQLAKSYAKMKDAEAINLHEKLKEEQKRVIKMEKKITEMAAQIASKQIRENGKDTPELMKNLAKQTALTVELRSQVKELETMLRDAEEGPDSKSHRRRQAPSPRTQKTLLETQRELRRARAQLKEIRELRDEVDRLKAELLLAEERSSKLAEENKKFRSGQSQDSSRGQKLELQVKEAKEELRRKDDELRKLRDEYDEFRNEAEARQNEAKCVLEKATDKISDLKKEIKTLKSGRSDPERRPKSYHGSSPEDAKDHPARCQGVISGITSEKSNWNAVKQETGRRSVDLADLEAMRESRDARHLHKLRALRDRFQADADLPESEPNLSTIQTNALADRPNLEKPRWQPYHPRSPRNRNYFTQDISKRIFSANDDPTYRKATHLGPLDLPAIGEQKPKFSRTTAASKDTSPIDLLQDRYARLGVTDANSSTPTTANTPRSSLPPERRAAAIARIEQRKAERKRTKMEAVNNKENIRP